MEKPLVYIVWANPDPEQPLHSLEMEAEGIRRVFQDSKHLEVAEPVIGAATLPDVVKMLRSDEARERAAIFHYAGHADGEGIYLQDRSGEKSEHAYVGGLAKLLAGLKSLQLVFVNGCLSEDHAKALYRAGIPSAVTTGERIPDGPAMQFAVQFYQELAKGRRVEDAFGAAEAILETIGGDSMARGGGTTDPLVGGGPPWELMGQRGWKLADLRLAGEGRFELAEELKKTCPYPGPRRFEGNESDYFFGREAESTQLLAAVKRAPVTVVYGDSGTGKSSLVRAGMMPKWEDEVGLGAVSLCFDPLEDPFAAFGRELERRFGDAAAGWEETPRNDLFRAAYEKFGAGKPWLVVIDQFEQIFTRLDDEVVRRRFVRSIENLRQFANPEIRLIAVIRSDLLGPLGEDPILAEIHNASNFMVPALRGRHLRAAMEYPALRHGVRFETGLLEELAADVEGRPGALSLLQYTLQTIWNREAGAGGLDDRVLNMGTYLAIDRVEGSLKQWVETFLEDHTEIDKRMMRGVLLKLVNVQKGKAGMPDVSRAMERSGFSDAQDKLVAALLEEHLLVSAEEGEKVELCHESLIEVWPGLGEWIDEYREVIPLHQRAVDLSAGWDRDGCPADFGDFLSGSELTRAVEAQAKGDFKRLEEGMDPAMVKSVREFVEAGEKHRKRRRFLSRAVKLGLPLFAGVVVLLGISVVALFEAKEANERANEATARLALHQAARMIEANDLPRAVAHYANALKLHSKEGNDALGGAVTCLPALIGSRVWDVESGEPIENAPQDEDSTRRIVVDRNGARVLTILRDGNTAQIQDEETGQPVGQMLSHSEFVNDAALSPCGRWAATASERGTVQVWEIESGKPVGNALRHGWKGTHVAFSPDGRRMVTASDDGTAQVWKVESGEPVGGFLRHESLDRAVFSSDGRRVVTASRVGTARSWDVDGRRMLAVVLRHDDDVYHAEFRTDGKRVLTASKDGTARLWDASSGRSVGKVLRHEGPVAHAAFSPDGRRVATVSADHTARVWNGDNGNLVGEPLLHEKEVSHVRFSPDGKRMVTASGCIVRVWIVETGQPVGEIMDTSGDVNSAEFSRDGRQLVTASNDRIGRAQVWDAENGRPMGEEFMASGWVVSAAFNSDGNRVVTGLEHGEARIWDWKSWEPIGETMKHQSYLYQMNFSLDGSRIVTASDDSTARVWELESGKPIGDPLRHSKGVGHAEFSRDGSRVVTVSGDRSDMRIWDVETGQPIGEPQLLGDHAYRAGFSPDGRRAVTAVKDGTARVWDVLIEMEPHEFGMLAELGELVSGYRVSDSVTMLKLQDITIGELRRKFADSLNDPPRDDWERYLQWLLWTGSDQLENTVSPLSTMTRRKYVEHMIAHGTKWSIDDALDLVPDPKHEIRNAIIDRLIEIAETDEVQRDWSLMMAEQVLLVFDRKDARLEKVWTLLDADSEKGSANGTNADPPASPGDMPMESGIESNHR